MWKSPLLKIRTPITTTKQNLRPWTFVGDAGTVDGKSPMPLLECVCVCLGGNWRFSPHWDCDEIHWWCEAIFQ